MTDLETLLKWSEFLRSSTPWLAVLAAIFALGICANEFISKKLESHVEATLVRQPRIITSAQVDLISRELRRFPPGNLDIEYFPDDDEIRELSNALIRAGHAATWTGDAMPTTRGVVKHRGLVIQVFDKEKMPLPARYLGDALKKARVRFRYVYNTEFEPWDVAWEIHVGEREKLEDLKQALEQSKAISK